LKSISYAALLQTLRISDWSNLSAKNLRSGSIFAFTESLMSLFITVTNSVFIICDDVLTVQLLTLYNAEYDVLKNEFYN
jgi:hypothetical protein